MLNNKLIEINELKKSFGGIQAVNVSDLSFQEGVLTSIIGPNGAGKTTFFDLISRFQAQDHGDIYFDGKKISADLRNQLKNEIIELKDGLLRGS